MKKIGIVFGLLMSMPVCADQLIILDEELVNQEIANIMRSRGIEPHAKQNARITTMLVHIFGAIGSQPQQTRGISLSQEFIIRKLNRKEAQSIADFYAMGFMQLQAGRLREALAAWCIVALHYPTTDQEEFLVNSAMEIVVRLREHNFPVFKIPARVPNPDTSLMIVPLMAPSTLLSAFLVG